ncbi:MAG: family 20 glycosylhydrolase [Verrucomicrobiota bacterium]
MKSALALLCSLTTCLSPLHAQSELPPIVPKPTGFSMTGGAFPLTPDCRIIFQTRKAPRAVETSLAPLAQVLAGEIEMLTGIRPAVAGHNESIKPRVGDILLRFDDPEGGFAETEAEEDQSYTLLSTPKGIIIDSAYFKGVAYGTATLLQSLQEKDGKFSVPAMRIEDAPAAQYRGVMIDVARKVHSIGVLKDVVRLARQLKIRYVHLHITDHQIFTFPFPPVTNNIEGNFTYTLEELKDLVAYADARGVTLIPELDLPGHSQRLKESGYLDPSESDADVASEANYGKITAIVDAMLEVFHTSPYFHIGADESAAGDKLVPFIGAINRHLRGNPPGGKRRLLVWEGFHGAPTDEVPATGDDRVVVFSWESSYNAPWDLLNAGYQIINASWAPTYILAKFGGPFHVGIPTGKKWSPKTLYSWDKDRFMHWEAGRAVFNDAGPEDPDRSDHSWDAEYIGKTDLVIGGQMQFWEQEEPSVIENLLQNLPALSERLWNPEVEGGFKDYEKRVELAMERILPIVQPVEILPGRPRNHHKSPVYDLFQPYSGDEIEITLRNRTKIKASPRYELIDGVHGGFSSFDFGKPKPVATDSPSFDKPLKKTGAFSIRTQLFSSDGTPIDGTTWGFFADWPQRIEVTEYDVKGLTAMGVPDLMALPKEKVLAEYQTPFFRGPFRDIRAIGHLQVADFIPPRDGDYSLRFEMSLGTGTLYVDLDGDVEWSEDEALVSDLKEGNQELDLPKALKGGQRYRIRVDHRTDTRHPLSVLKVKGPEINDFVDISEFLELPESE